jgi:hypothetical protein
VSAPNFVPQLQRERLPKLTLAKRVTAVGMAVSRLMPITKLWVGCRCGDSRRAVLCEGQPKRPSRPMRFVRPQGAFLFVAFSVMASAQNQVPQQDAEIVTDRPDITESSIVIPKASI